MADRGSGERTEKPTAKRLTEARKQGQVARTPDLAVWAGVLVVSMLVPGLLATTRDQLTELLRALPQVVADPQPSVALGLAGQAVRAVAVATVPLLLSAAAVAAVAGVAQGGSRPYLSRLKPRGARLNPATSLKRMVGPQGWWEVTKQLLKTVVVAVVVWRLLVGSTDLLMRSGGLPLGTVAAATGTALAQLVRTVATLGLGIAAGDYLIARRRVTKQLMMSRKEVQDEYKQNEGDPHVKAALRRRALAAARNRMMLEVPQADVVLVNPTHVAVALRYEPGLGAPRVVAKGAGVLAARIRELAAEHRVPMVEDVPLARALHRSCEVGAEIPRDMYTAVAKVLAFVMALRSRGVHAGLHRAPRSAPTRG